VAREGLNIENLVNKSKKEMAATVMDVAKLPTQDALDAIAAIPGVVRVRTF
jgi:D-3-phosphoglycerate dehydrogenase